MNQTYRTLKESLQDDVLQHLRKVKAKFFENIVGDFLVASGYGTKKDLQILGRTGDRGIDGLIKRDVLRFEEVYFQAKRWTDSVGSPTVAQFVGNLERAKAKKGVMITTSDFSKDAKAFEKDIGNKIRLVDGKEFARFMIDYNVGVIEDETYTVKKIDEDYFLSKYPSESTEQSAG